MEYDVVVVGAGPAGSMAAKYAAMNGARTALLEEHYAIGEPVQCAGLVSVAGINECEVTQNELFVNREINGAFLYSPDCRSIPIRGDETKAYVIERRIFDRILSQNAIDAGVDLHLNSKVVGLKRRADGQILTVISGGKETEICANVVIGADGVRSKIAKLSGLGDVKKIIPAVQIEGRYKARDPSFVEMFVGDKIAPGFFAWCIPTEENMARIGLCSDDAPLEHLQTLLSSHPIISRRYRGSVTDFVVGSVPLGPLKKTIADGVMIVGDAAGQVKPTTGGGVYTGALCAKIAGEVAAKVAKQGDASLKNLKEYEKRWRASLNREFSTGMFINKTIGKLDDSDFNDFVSTLNDPDILEIITKYGDMDHPSILVRRSLRLLNLPRLRLALRLGRKALF
ncbi:MAG: NAD(P)/FAD-dependent oxidoreductase [Halobacteriota archaeon]|nr:NAD(P)/FAD-dependent oxidoreductase [Halobacteriota archaeon]